MGIDRENIYYQTGATLEIDAVDAALPDALADAHLVTNAANLKGPRYVNVLGSIRNAADDAEGTTALWAWPCWWMHNAGRWFVGAGIKFHLQSEIEADTSGLKGNAYKLDKPQGANGFYLYCPATVAAGNVLHAEVEVDT